MLRCLILACLYGVFGLFAAPVHSGIEIDLGFEASDPAASTTSTQVFVERVELVFPNQAPTISVNTGSKGHYAIARFRYVGNGSLTARWLVDGRVISQQAMILAFGKDVEIRSDANNVYLPTFEPGYHKVSLQLVNSSGLIDESARSITYFVGKGAGSAQSGQQLVLMYPQNRMVDSRNFYFRWKGDKAFSSYLLEVEKLGSAAGKTNTVMRALSKYDVYSPTDTQRDNLDSGRYRWRVKAKVDSVIAEVVSDWAVFDVDRQGAGGFFITGIETRTIAPDTAATAGISSQVFDTTPANQVDQSLAMVANGRVDSGSPYQLTLELQNTRRTNTGNAFVEISNAGGLLGVYPINLDTGKSASVSIPLQAGATTQPSLESLTIRLMVGNNVQDEAAVNLVVEPKLRLDKVDFSEVQTIGSTVLPITDPHGCATGQANSSLAFSRMVSAQSGDQNSAAQSLLQQGHFVFDEGQQVQFTAFLKDNGLGAWFDGPDGACYIQTPGGVIQARNHPLQFVAQPLDRFGQAVGSPVIVGEVSFTTGFEGLITSPPWTIPASGQYKVSLHNLGEAADLYATLPGGYPKYIHAAGFVSELQSPVSTGSSMMAGSPRQAIINGQAITRWKGDINNNVIPLTLNQVSVTMDNPLHGRLSGGELKLKKAPNMIVPRLGLFGETHNLLDLTLGLGGATARLDYQLPQSFQSSSSRAGSATNIIVFENVDVINGGEFVARHEFDDRWQDQSINNGDLALRVRGSTLVVDASPILNYTDYTQAAGFTGVGLHNANLRIRINQSNGLFSVANPEQAFIYGRAQWLYFNNGTLAGENITVVPAADIAPFFNQPATETHALLQPLGFDIQITGGEFSLQDSKVGGVNFSGQLTVSEQSPLAGIMNAPFYFNHLVRSQQSQYQFVTENKANQSMQWQVDAYRYQPQTIQLHIGGVNQRRETTPGLTASNPGIVDRHQQSPQQWQQQLQDNLQSQAGLLATGGELIRPWPTLEGSGKGGENYGVFLLNTTGLHGQWQEMDDARAYQLNGFDTRISQLWLKFEDSALTDSEVSGFLDIPRPVAHSFRFSGELDQQAELWIPANGLSFPEGNELLLSYWHARLKNAAIPQADNTTVALVREAVPAQPVPVDSPIIYDRERQRIQLTGMQLLLDVDNRLGGPEFTTETGTPPFVVDTDILPDGQLVDTRAYPVSESLYFLGLPFEVSEIRFTPYFGLDEDADIATAQPLVEVDGSVFFKVFGSRQVKIQHTALGAQIPVITGQQPGGTGEGMLRVAAQLKFINTYAMNAEITGGYAQQASEGVAASAANVEVNSQPFKAFVGSADLVILDTVSIRGLAEAGLHNQQNLVDGRWQDPANTANTTPVVKAYERIGLGLGVDAFKAVMAGVNSLDTATTLGGSVISAAAGVEGTGEQAVQLGADAVNFVGMVALAVGTSGGGGEVVRQAVGSGMQVTSSGIELLKMICDERNDCGQNQSLMLDISSLLARVAESLTRFENLTPKKIASISLQTLDVGIPLLMGFNLDQAYAATGASPLSINGTQISLNDKKNAALSVSRVMVSASRTLLDNNLQIPFRDFLNISRQTVTAARYVKDMQGVEAGLDSLGPANQLLDLSLDLADASIFMASGFQSGDSNSAQALLNVTGQLVDILCQQSTALQPLFVRAGVPAAGDAVQAPLNLSRAMLDKFSTQSLPQDATQMLAQLQQLLHALAAGDGSLRGCGQGTVRLPAAARAVLKMAAHSLQPIDGSLLGNTGAQMAWALQSVNLSVDTLDALAQQIGMNQLPSQVQEIKAVLAHLSMTFADLGNDINPGGSGQAVSARAVLKLAQDIPAAMRELVVTHGSQQAADILDLHIVLMRELQPLVNNATAIAAGDISNVDLYALPTALLNEVQDLSLLSQCQKSALSNLSMSMGIARQISSEQADGQARVSGIINNMDSIYQNIRACDSTGISDVPQISQFMQMLKLLLAIHENPQRLHSIVMAAVPQILPLFVDSSQQMLASINAFTQALPLVDFTQDQRVEVLDGVLDRLLAEAELNSRDAASRDAIRKARSIIRHADLNMTGLTLNRDESGQLLEIKELRADGSWRIFNLQVAAARQFFPEAHPGYTGGLEELVFQVFLNTPFEQLPLADQQSLFTPFWDNLIDGGEVQQRRYKDGDGNKIAIERLDAIHVSIVNGVSRARFTPSRLFTVATMPARETSAADLDGQMQSLLRADVYREYGEANPDCFFSSGCAYRSITGSGRFTVQSVGNPQHFAIYDDAVESRSSLSNFRPTGRLFQFEGYINDNSNNWNPAWRVFFDNSGTLTLLQGDSQETLDLGEQFNLTSPAQIPALLAGVNEFRHRRVVNGNDIWEYQSGQSIVHSYGNGNWEIYRMPETLPPGTAVPAPRQILDVAQLELMAKGDSNGIIENPANLNPSIDAAGTAVALTLPAENADESISIALSGDNAGGVMIGQTELAVVAAANVAASQIASTEQQADGSQVITQTNGDIQTIHGSADDNLRISQTTTLTPRVSETGVTDNIYRRSVTIQYCTDKNKSWAQCPPAERFERRFEYDWVTDVDSSIGYVDFDLAQRPVITPASGLNQAIKHQFWRDIFTLETELLRNPSEAGLQQLDDLIARAKDAGLPDEELQQQAYYIRARVINRMMVNVFDEADQYITDLAKQNEWKNNQAISPVYRLSKLHQRLQATGLQADRNFVQKYLQLLNLNYRLYLHDLQGLDIAGINSNALLNDELVKKISAITDIIGDMALMGDESPITENFDFACTAIDRAKQKIKTSIIDNSNARVLDSDIELIINLEENSSIMGCANSNSLLADIDGLVQRIIGGANADYDGMVDAMRLRRLAQAITRQDPAQDDFNQDGVLNTQDLVVFYGTILSADGIDVSQPPVSTQFDLWLQHIANLKRLIQEVDGERERRNGNTAFDAAPFNDLMLQLADGLKQGWVYDYQQPYELFVATSSTTSLDSLKTLAAHVEKNESAAQRLQGLTGRNSIILDGSQYLRVTIDNSQFAPIDEIISHQQQWINHLWLQTPASISDWNATVNKLQEQDHVIRYLQAIIGADTPADLKNFDQAIVDKINNELSGLPADMASLQTPADMESRLQIIQRMVAFLKPLSLDESDQRLQQQVQQLVDQSIERIRQNPDSSQLEIQKILAITTAFGGIDSIAGNGLQSNSNIRAAIHEAGTAQLNIINNGGDMADINAFIALVGLEAQLGINDPEWSVSDVYGRMNELIADAKSRLLSSNDLELIPDYMDLWAAGQMMGLPANQDFAAVVTVINSHRGTLAACIQQQNCTFDHIARYTELSASIAELGEDEGDFSGLIAQMLSSIQQGDSVKDGAHLPVLKDIVRRDKNADRGRPAVADVLEKMANGFSMGVASGRDAIRSIIDQLQGLANLSLPSGFNKPAPSLDPLLQSANRLKQKLDDWLAQLRQQMAQRLAAQGGVILGENPQEMAQGLGISEDELNNIVLPDLNPELNNNDDVRIVPANKYRLAAEALAPITYIQNDAELRLSMRLLENLPDPAITAEADYRLATMSQLSLYLLDSSGEALPAVITADTIKQTALGGVVLTLLSLPAEERPANALFAYVKQTLLASNNSDTCNNIYRCMLDSSMQLTANVLDSSLLSLQQNRTLLMRQNQQQLVMGILQKMAQNLSQLAQTDNSDPLIFWTGMGAEAMNLSLQLLDGPVNDKTLLVSALQLSNRVLGSPLIENLVDQAGQTVVQIPVAYGFVTGTSQLLVQQLEASTDAHLPIAIARMANQRLFAVLGKLGLDQRLLTTGELLGNWQLDLADQPNTWALMTSLNTTPVAWLNVLLGEGGIAKLNSHLNNSGLLPIKVPAALSLTPFIAAQSLLNNQAALQNSQQRYQVMADLMADISNSWFLPLDYQSGFDAADDKPLAVLLRQVKTINPDDSNTVRALQLVGAVGMGGIKILLPDSVLGKVMDIAWNGSDTGGAGIVHVLDLGMQGGSANPAQILQLVQGIPATTSAMLTAIAEGNEGTALLLRIISATTKENDLLAPDQPQDIAVLQSILVSMGEVRKLLAPQLVGEQHNTDPNLGYLRTVPFISMEGNPARPVIADNMPGSMQDMVDMARDYTSGGSLETVQQAVQKVSLGGVDIARLGINALAPLLDSNRQSEVASIQQRAIFSGLVEGSDTPGFSGVSGGLQSQWTPGNGAERNNADITLEMYGQLAFPLLGKQVGLMQLIQDGTGDYLFFEAAAEEAAGSRMVGGLSGGMKAELRATNQSLNIAYWGQSKIQILGNTMGDAQVSGLIDNFPNPANASDAASYARQLIEQTNIASCGSLETAILPFPLTLSGLAGTATVGAFAEKNGLGLKTGVRVGLSGEINTPVVPSLLGIKQSGNITTAYSGELDPADTSISLQADSCIAPALSLKFLGRSIPLSAGEISSQLESTQTPDSNITDVKFKITLSSNVVSTLKGDACNGFEIDDLYNSVVKQGICHVLDTITGETDLWIVLHNQISLSSPTDNGQKLFFGIGRFPGVNRQSDPFIEADLSQQTLNLRTQSGNWGGWNESSSTFDLCNQNLCELSRFRAAPESPQ